MTFLTISDYQAPFILYRDNDALVVHVTDSNHRTICTFGEYTQVNLSDTVSLTAEYDSHIELALFIASSMNDKLGIEMPLSLKDCFDSNGNLKYDPYRYNPASNHRIHRIEFRCMRYEQDFRDYIGTDHISDCHCYRNNL